MIPFDRFTLDNGLKVLVNEDNTTPIITVNILYNVGSRHESPHKTGFAHLFEHLMFGGSVNIPVFDTPLENVGGDNNAFTNTDITNYYIQIPKPNLETAFWLESDRMLSLAFSEKSLEVQRNVVIEEFRQRYINQPFGDAMGLLRGLVYTTHPYQWPTIGKEISHIENATMEDVKSFYQRFYNPNNAIMSVSGDITTEEVKPLIEKWFGDIENIDFTTPKIAIEPPQVSKKTLSVKKDVPHHMIFKAYRMCDRMHPDYHIFDLITDILANGDSSRLYQNLVKEKKLFTNIDAYITGEIDEGMLIINGSLSETTTMEAAEAAIEEEVNQLKNSKIQDLELQKLINKAEATMTFQEISGFNKGYLLSYYELLGDAEMLNNEIEKYREINADDIIRVAQESLTEERANVLYYFSAHKAEVK